jgi:hypothetical protein
MLLGFIEAQPPLVQNDGPITEPERARDMVRSHDNGMASGAMPAKKSLQHVDTAAIEDAIGLVEQKQPGIEKLPFGDRGSEFHPARERANKIIATPGKADAFKRGVEGFTRGSVLIK